MRRTRARINPRTVLVLCVAIAGAAALLLAGCGRQATQTTLTTVGEGLTSTTALSTTSSEAPGTTGSSTTGVSVSTTLVPTTTEAPTTSETAVSTTSTEAPVAVENNPPGDIPDNQVFVDYKTSAGFTVQIPEGWARVENASSTSFTDKLNTILIEWANAPSAPTVASVQATEVPQLQATSRAFELVKVSAVKLPAGDAVLVTYRINSEPNSVTGKQYRLDVLRYSYFNNGLRVDITLSSPVGADNVDPWNIVSRSLKWQ